MIREVVALVVLCCVLPVRAQGESVSRVQDNIRMVLTLDKPGPYFPNQRIGIELRLEVDGHFYGNIEVEQPLIDDAVVVYDAKAEFDKALEKQVTNPRQIAKKSFTLFPRRDGTMSFGPLVINTVALDNADGEYHQRRLLTEKLDLVVERPEALQGLAEPLISEEVLLDVEITPAKATTFEIGDSVSLSYTLSALNGHASLLPEIELPELPGTSRYRKPPRTRNWRDYYGQPVAVRMDQATYIFQQPGEVVVPARRLPWWDPATQSVRYVNLPAHHWTVLGPPPPWWRSPHFMMIVLAAVGLTMAVGLWRRRQAIIALYHRLNDSDRKRMERAYWQAFAQSNWRGMWQQLNALEQSDDAVQSNDEPWALLHCLAFGENSGSLDRAQAMTLLLSVRTRRRQANRLKALDLNLNR